MTTIYQTETKDEAAGALQVGLSQHNEEIEVLSSKIAELRLELSSLIAQRNEMTRDRDRMERALKMLSGKPMRRRSKKENAQP